MENQEKKEIWILVQIDEVSKRPLVVTYELLGEGRKLAAHRNHRLSAVVCGNVSEILAEDLFSYGADKVYFLHREKTEFDRLENYLDDLENLIRKHEPEMLFAGSTDAGHEIMARLAVRLQTGLTVDCTSFEIDETDGHLCQIRPAFGGMLMASIKTISSSVQMSMVQANMLKNPERMKGRNGIIIRENIKGKQKYPKITILERRKQKEKACILSQASILIGGGLGIGSKEGFELLEDVAQKLHGCVVGTRAALNAGWISKEQMIGQTGHTAAPELYIACGISGAVQHMAGIKNAKCIIAINNEKNAPVFGYADYGFLGDYKKILPLLLKKIENYEEQINGKK